MSLLNWFWKGLHIVAFCFIGVHLLSSFTHPWDFEMVPPGELSALQREAQECRDRREMERHQEKERRGEQLNAREQRAQAEMESRSLQNNP